MTTSSPLERGGDGELSRIARLEMERRLTGQKGEDPYAVVMRDVRREIGQLYEAGQLVEASPEVRSSVEILIGERIAAYQEMALSQRLQPFLEDVDLVVQRMLNEIFGLGPLQPLLEDNTIEEISINGPGCVLSDGELGKRRHKISFSSPEEVVALVNRAIAHTGRKLDTASPWVDGHLATGARLHASTYPIAEPWPSVSIRIHRLVARRMEDLVRLRTVTPQVARFLEMVVSSRLAVLITGGTRTGKTNFINVLCGLIDPSERMVVIEDTRELEIPLEDVVYLVKRIPGMDGKGEIGQQRLVANALRMGPDRIIMAEARDKAAFDMLKAANTGHEGTMATVHADTAEEALDRLEVLAYEAEDARNLSQRSIRRYIAGAFQYVILLTRVRGTTERKVVEILELPGSLEGEVIRRQLLFVDRGDGKGLIWTGIRPHWGERFRACGFDFEEVISTSDQSEVRAETQLSEASAVVRGGN